MSGPLARQPLPRAAEGSASVTVFASPGSWIESDAIAQCHQVAALPGMIHVAGQPDLHPGKGAPIGAAMASTVLYPFLVGSDIGCGIAVFPIRLKQTEPAKLVARFPDLVGRARPGGRAHRADCRRGPHPGRDPRPYLPASQGCGAWGRAARARRRHTLNRLLPRRR